MKNLENITVTLPHMSVDVPNRWELLTPGLYLYLCTLLQDYAAGKISFRSLHLLYVCRALSLDPAKIKDPAASENLYLISSAVDFIFETPVKLNSCFLKQLVPEARIKDRLYPSYSINTTFGSLTSSLVALQYIEAYELLGSGKEKLPLLAAILYCPGAYDSIKAHALAGDFALLPASLLEAISLNFLAFSNYLFTRTPFSILRGKAKEKPRISTGMAECLYDLSAEGLGDSEKVERMPVIKYLMLLRKKLIESVRTMHEAGIDIVEISEKTGIEINRIKQIIK
jgi:hypothetical protein